MRHFSLTQILTFSLAPSSSDGLAHSSGRVAQHQHQSATTSSMPVPLKEEHVTGRRRALQSIFASGAAFVGGSANKVNALDMDAFVNSQLEADTKNCDPKRDPKCKPTLSEDEALCKYGQSGEARGEACKRVKAAGGELPKPGSGGKSLGGAYAM